MNIKTQTIPLMVLLAISYLKILNEKILYYLKDFIVYLIYVDLMLV